MPKQLQQLLAEVLGTFVLVFLGAGAVMGFGAGADPFAFGIGLLAALYAFAEVSGGHFNPIVSLVMFLDQRLKIRELGTYWAAQFVGAVLAALGLLLMTSSNDVAKAATVPGQGGVRAAFFVEVFASAIFMIIILQVTKSEKVQSTVYVAIGLTLLATQYASVPFSGGSQNPARSFGTALIGGKWTDFWIYLLAPTAGAILGWLVYAVVIKGNMNLRDDFDAMRKELSAATPGGGDAGGGTAS
jgi:MIP family channel proteins